MNDDTHAPSCTCEHCTYGREVARQLEGLSIEQSTFFIDLYERLMGVEMEEDDDSWTSDEQIILPEMMRNFRKYMEEEIRLDLQVKRLGSYGWRPSKHAKGRGKSK